MKINNVCTILLCSALIVLGGCSTSAKQKLGLERQVPDEFSVVKRAPLSMPPDMSLQKPQPGAPRPQEQATSDEARQALFGAPGAGGGSDGGDTAFLAQAGATNANPKIRSQVDAETAKLSKENIPVARKLFGLGGDPDSAPVSVVNAKAETERLQKNKDEGKSVTTGETPTVEQ